MVKQGRVYVSLPPLYCWGKSTKDYGWCNRVEDIPADAKDVHRFKGLGEMNDDQLYYFLVDKNTRNVLQIEYPSDIDEFNKILGTSEGKGSLLKDLGIILNSETRVFTNPEPIVKVAAEKIEELQIKETKVVEKKTTKKSSTKKIAIVGEGKPSMPAVTDLFAGLFD
jgi:nitrogenase molybdenum-iron protein alpha/beta subunit